MQHRARTAADRARSLLRRTAMVRARDLVAAGISRTQIARMTASGDLVRIARGVYGSPEQGSENTALVTVARRAPGAVFCLLTALRLHGLTTQEPFEVWIAIANKDRAPKLDYPALRIVRFSNASLHAGIEVQKFEGVAVRLTNVPKTIADCFKFRNKVGLDVALEALREVVRDRRATMDDLWKYAKVNRVANVMRPYLEAVA